MPLIYKSRLAYLITLQPTSASIVGSDLFGYRGFYFWWGKLSSPPYPLSALKLLGLKFPWEGYGGGRTSVGNVMGTGL